MAIRRALEHPWPVVGGVVEGNAYCKYCLGIETTPEEYEIAGVEPVFGDDFGLGGMDCGNCHALLWEVT